jgi:DNA-binding CsgD family transcriptional regulator
MDFENSGATAEELQAVLARFETAVLTVDRFLRLYFANPAACALLERGDGLRLNGGHLHARKTNDTRAIAAAVGETPARSVGGVTPLAASKAQADKANAVVTVWRGDEAAAYRVVVSPLVSNRTAASADAVLFVDSPHEAHGGAEAALFQRAFQLTPAEARLAAHLASGASLTEAADAFGVTHNTVRSQLRAVFEKTQARRQADLVCVLQEYRSVRLSLS